jgi:acyl-CoA thioester hydrolase
MARVNLELPDNFPYSTEISVHISEINFAHHVGADGMLSLMHEARISFLKNYGYQEYDVEGLGIIIADAVVLYKSEAFHGEVLEVSITVGDFSRYGCDIFYRLVKKDTKKEVARAKTGILFFDYRKKEKAEVPAKFQELFSV